MWSEVSWQSCDHFCAIVGSNLRLRICWYVQFSLHDRSEIFLNVSESFINLKIHTITVSTSVISDFRAAPCSSPGIPQRMRNNHKMLALGLLISSDCVEQIVLFQTYNFGGQFALLVRSTCLIAFSPFTEPEALICGILSLLIFSIHCITPVFMSTSCSIFLHHEVSRCNCSLLLHQ